MWLFFALLFTSAVVTTLAMRRTSTTFDEIVLIAGGARGYHTGKWRIASEHPPLMQYIYGLPVHLTQPKYPDETGILPAQEKHMAYRYYYAKQLFWQTGNDPEKLAFLGRIPAVLCALGLLCAVFFFGRSVIGNAGALLATFMVAFLPDVLAHGGVAYNDVPVALAIFASVCLIDRAVRSGGWRAGLLAGLSVGFALGVKNSAVTLAPIAVLLLIAEAVGRWRDPAWRRAIGQVVVAGACAVYVALVVIYRGDYALTEYRYSIGFAMRHVVAQVPAFLVGQHSVTGWWYFFPVAFVFKTSAAFHALMIIALVTLGAAAWRAPRRIIEHPLRAAVVATCVLAVFLVRANLNLGFRYALPIMPFVCVLTAAGIVRAWPTAQRAVRGVIVVACIWLAGHVLSYYPHFLAYISEYGPARAENHTILADSSLDWGQSLLELRNFMQRNNVPSVYLSYFGSALPEGYGIRYLPLISFFELPGQAPLPEEPKWVAISATNLEGVYVGEEAFRRFRDVRPNEVLGYTMFLYRVRD